MNMVEKVARKIATVSWRNGLDPHQDKDQWGQAADAYDLTSNNGRFHFDEMARAAIEAMKEPTKEMVEAARAHHEGEAYLPHSLFNAMITAALSEESTS